MTVFNQRVTLGTAAQIVVPSHSNPQEVVLHNDDKSSNNFVFVGGHAVTKDEGLELFPEEHVTLNLQPGDALYAVSDPAGIICSVIAMRK